MHLCVIRVLLAPVVRIRDLSSGLGGRVSTVAGRAEPGGPQLSKRPTRTFLKLAVPRASFRVVHCLKFEGLLSCPGIDRDMVVALPSTTAYLELVGADKLKSVINQRPCYQNRSIAALASSTNGVPICANHLEARPPRLAPCRMDATVEPSSSFWLPRASFSVAAGTGSGFSSQLHKAPASEYE